MRTLLRHTFFLPLPDLSRKIEGDSVRRVFLHMPLPKHKKTLSYFHIKNLVKKTSFFLWSLVNYISELLLFEKFLDT